MELVLHLFPSVHCTGLNLEDLDRWGLLKDSHKNTIVWGCRYVNPNWESPQNHPVMRSVTIFGSSGEIYRSRLNHGSCSQYLNVFEIFQLLLTGISMLPYFFTILYASAADDDAGAAAVWAGAGAGGEVSKIVRVLVKVSVSPTAVGRSPRRSPKLFAMEKEQCQAPSLLSSAWDR